jgi:hypothetical protein
MVATLIQVPEQFETVHARHHQIRNDDVRIERSEPLQCFLPVGGDLRFKVAIGKHGDQSIPLALIVIYNEDSARGCWLCRHYVVIVAAAASETGTNDSARPVSWRRRIPVTYRAVRF